eukprot:8225584-Pyramimonas_sp.AAC.1
MKFLGKTRHARRADARERPAWQQLARIVVPPTRAQGRANDSGMRRQRPAWQNPMNMLKD